jgi:hypothetical protein
MLREGFARCACSAVFYALVCIACGTGKRAVAEEDYPRVQITDPFIEMRTGFGDEYPIFHVVERGAWVFIVKRHTDWFKIRTERGTEGWAHRGQLERTLTEAGVGTTFRDVLLDDFLSRRLEVGIAGGVAEDDPVMSAHLGYVLTRNFITELGLSRITGTFSTSTIWSLNLVSQPVPGGRFVPYFTLGVGRFENTPSATLVDAESIDAVALNAGVGLRYYITRRFVLRADIKNYAVLVDDNRTSEIYEFLLGLSFFL